MKRHDRQTDRHTHTHTHTHTHPHTHTHTTLCTTGFCNSVLCLVSCSSINQVPYSILNKAVTDPNLTRLLQKQTNKQTNSKQTNKQKKLLKKPHIGQVFQSVTSFET